MVVFFFVARFGFFSKDKKRATCRRTEAGARYCSRNKNARNLGPLLFVVKQIIKNGCSFVTRPFLPVLCLTRTPRDATPRRSMPRHATRGWINRRQRRSEGGRGGQGGGAGGGRRRRGEDDGGGGVRAAAGGGGEGERDGGGAVAGHARPGAGGVEGAAGGGRDQQVRRGRGEREMAMVGRGFCLFVCLFVGA